MALQIALQQTPYLDLLTGDKVRESMGVLNLPRDARVTPDVAGRVCGSLPFGQVVRKGNWRGSHLASWRVSGRKARMSALPCSRQRRTKINLAEIGL
jgi:hypothetical protein